MSRDSALEGNWVVTAYRSGEEMVEPDPRAEASLMIDGALIAGTMGVNRFSGSVDGDLPVGPLATTRMAGPEELMRQEDTLLELLESADVIEVVDEGMFFKSDGLILIELERSGTNASVSPS